MLRLEAFCNKVKEPTEKAPLSISLHLHIQLQRSSCLACKSFKSATKIVCLHTIRCSLLLQIGIQMHFLLHVSIHSESQSCSWTRNLLFSDQSRNETCNPWGTFGLQTERPDFDSYTKCTYDNDIRICDGVEAPRLTGDSANIFA